ncbi:hypothetical protein HDU97_002812 [Phlyctochytrium planicorne]|nr:hypothetical protein HDU97_002812 [Phlyctochytrium planicorne]
MRKLAYPKSVYFKSTDGHYGNWDFNMRRLNSHILEVIADNHGCIIVDSTRHGKRIPDSFGKTIPIWCNVINYAVDAFRKETGAEVVGEWDTKLHTLPSAVSRTEHEQIEAKVQEFASKLLGLTPKLFWEHRDAILDVSDGDECENLVKTIVKENVGSVRTEDVAGESKKGSESFTWIGDTGLAIGNRASGDPAHCWYSFSAVINCGAPEHPAMSSLPDGKAYLYLPIPEGKKGQQVLYDSIPTAMAFLCDEIRKGGRVLVHCMQGRDRSVAITLAFLVQYLRDQKLELDNPILRGDVTKQKVQDTLVYIQGFRYIVSSNLPGEVNRRLIALKNLQEQHSGIEAKFREEVMALEKKYLEQYKPLYEKRAAIVSGTVEPTDAECNRAVPKDDEEHIEDIGPASAPPADGSGVKGIPGFWFTALKNHPELGSTITDRDEPALKSLVNISYSYLDNTPGFKLEFTFDSNDYFENKVLTKTYFLINSPDSTYGDIIFDKAEGTDIKWKEGKDLNYTIELKKQRHKASNKTRTVKKTVPAETFFSFFTPPSAHDEDDEDEEKAGLVEADYEFGEIIKEKIIPNAIDWFTGKALTYEGFDEDEDWEGEGEDDDEDEDGLDGDDDGEDGEGAEAGGPKEQPPECKQQ